MMDISRHPALRGSADGTVLAGDLRDNDGVRAAFVKLARAHDFRGFLVMFVPSRSGRSLAKWVLMTDWPEDLFAAYESAGLMVGSPFFERLRRSTVPFDFDAIKRAESREDTISLKRSAMFKEAGLPRGVCIPVHDSSGRCGAVCFGGDRSDVGPEEMSVLLFIASHLFQCLSEIRSKKSNRTSSALSRREIECLRWAAAGRTTVEMAKILNLSEYTVNHYLSRATRKLDSVNRVQTVAKAIRAGLIV